MSRAPAPTREQLVGWTRTDQRPWQKCRARWLHVAGWRIEHCGHPTANQPWALYEPGGRMVLTGVEGPLKRADYGVAWPGLALAMDYVARVLAGREVPPRWPACEVA